MLHTCIIPSTIKKNAHNLRTVRSKNASVRWRPQWGIWKLACYLFWVDSSYSGIHVVKKRISYVFRSKPGIETDYKSSVLPLRRFRLGSMLLPTKMKDIANTTGHVRADVDQNKTCHQYEQTELFTNTYTAVVLL